MTDIQFILYNLPDGNGSVQAYIQKETIWLTQKAMSQLFDVSIPAINQHLKNIYETQELTPESTIKKNLIVQQEGTRQVKREQTFYSLDAIISVGYRVNSRKATRFRQWATAVLNEFIRKGFVMDDERLKQGISTFGKDYFRELLERVRSIRASERRIWQQITDIFAECSTDYDRDSSTTREFYAMIQNRFHYAITGMTAAEKIMMSADHTKPHMGLATWKLAPGGRVLKSDVAIAKNYLSEKEIRRLERGVTAYFDYIENQIEMQKSFTMEQFSASVDRFLAFNDYKILSGKGSVSAQEAKEKAEREYDLFNPMQQIDSDFDKKIRKMLDNNKYKI